MIITQELINEAQKIIKKHFIIHCRNIFNSKLNLYLNSAEDTAYSHFMLNIKQNLNSVVIKTLESAIPEIDRYFFDSKYKKTYFYHTKK